MYEAVEIANRIKLRAKQQNVQLKIVLERCGLSKIQYPLCCPVVQRQSPKILQKLRINWIAPWIIFWGGQRIRR